MTEDYMNESCASRWVSGVRSNDSGSEHYGRIVKAFCFAFHDLTDVSPVARNKNKMGLQRKFHIH
jgi:hypothetical protein